MMNTDNFKHYIRYLVARFRRKIKEAQDSKNHSSSAEDDAYKMGYLMALYEIVDEMRFSASDFDIERKDTGLEYTFSETYVNLLMNLSYISAKRYQKRIKFNDKDYAGEFHQLNDHTLNHCERLHVLAEFNEKCQALLVKLYCHLEPYFQNYDGMYESDKKQSWKEIVAIAKEILNAFEFHNKPRLLKSDFAIELSKKECEYLSQAPFLPKFLKKWYFSDEKTSFHFEIHPPHADEIRDLCRTQLQNIAFDKESEPTEEVKILEALIDKLCVGFFNGERKENRLSRMINNLVLAKDVLKAFIMNKINLGSRKNDNRQRQSD
jgi:hypothetical protein